MEQDGDSRHQTTSARLLRRVDDGSRPRRAAPADIRDIRLRYRRAGTIEGPETFLAAAGSLRDAVTTLRSEAYDGADAFQLYEAVSGKARVKIAEHLTVRECPIVARSSSIPRRSRRS